MTEILPMTEKSVKDIALCERTCFSSPWSEEGIRAELSNPTAHFFTLSFDGEFAGYCGMHEVCGECYIANIAVMPKFRRMGAASMLLKKLISLCEENGWEFISLEVRKSNMAAISLYEKFLFVPVGERKNFYTNPQEDAIIMTRNFKTGDNI